MTAPSKVLRLGALGALCLAAAPIAHGWAAPQTPGRGEPTINEYMPKDIYVRGDPHPLTPANARSGKRVNFVACPVIMDAEPTPCWLTRHNGDTYFLRAQQNLSADVHHPQLLHKVLVEGVVSDEPRICGGKVLNPLWISVMREIDASCNERLPAHDGLHPEVAKRPPGPGPNGKRRDARNIQRISLMHKLDKTRAEYVRDPVPRETRSFTVPFEFDSDFMYAYAQVTAAAKFFKDLDASKMRIDVYRGSVLLDDGKVMVERDGVVQDRINNLLAILDDYKIPRDHLQIERHDEPAPADGIDDFANRRAVLKVTP